METDIMEKAERYLSGTGEYSRSYEREKLIANWEKKERDADMLVVDFQRRVGQLEGKELLELGFGSGLHIPAFVQAGAKIRGLEVSPVLVGIAKEILHERGIPAELQLYDGVHMPYADSSFDYAFATTVLEHVSELKSVLHEVDRILVSGGRGYFSFPNRWAFKESHTGFYLISYFPRWVVRPLLRLFGSNAVDELNLHFLSYFSFLRAIRNTELRVVFETQADSIPKRILKSILAALGIHHSILLRTIMVVLEKAE